MRFENNVGMRHHGSWRQEFFKKDIGDQVSTRDN
jgi:hypothetical protein